MTTTSESYIHNQVTTDGWIHSDKHTTYSGSSSTDSYYSSRRYTMESFNGGNISYHSSDKWNEWVFSGANMINPVPISIRLTPIYTLIDDPIRRSNMERAYNEYFAMRKKEQEKIIEEKQLGPRDVTMAWFRPMPVQTTNRVGIWKVDYLTGPTVVKMVTNTTTAPIGQDGSCTHVTTNGATVAQYAYAYLGMFQCQRDINGAVITKHYFDPNAWITQNYNQECTRIKLSVVDPINKEIHDYGWTCDNICYATDKTSPMTKSTGDMRKYYEIAYLTEYRYGTPQYHYVWTFDGLYQTTRASLTNFPNGGHKGGGYFTCYLDCSGSLNIPLDQYGNPTDVQCMC